MIILGISGFENSVPFKRSRWPGLDEREYRISQGHDSAAALVRDGAVVAAAAEERFSRRKHTGDFPERAIAYCLEAAGGRPSSGPANRIEDANIFAASYYRPRLYPGRLTLIRSTDRRAEDGDDAYLGWGHLIGGGIDVYHIPSTHLNILQEPAVQVLSARLRDCRYRDPATRTEGPAVACGDPSATPVLPPSFMVSDLGRPTTTVGPV
jgi:hypothetical protein